MILNSKTIYRVTYELYTILCRNFTDKPHIAGSDIQLEYGERIKTEWSSYHELMEVKTFPYNVLLSYLEKDETNIVTAFNDSGDSRETLHEFKGKEKVSNNSFSACTGLDF